jgi:hypothetical protein
MRDNDTLLICTLQSDWSVRVTQMKEEQETRTLLIALRRLARAVSFPDDPRLVRSFATTSIQS